MKKRLVIIFLFIVTIGIAWTVYSALQKEASRNVVEASGTIQTTEIQVGSRLGGRIEAVLAKEGDTVQAGQMLVRFDGYQLPAQRSGLEAQLAQAEAQLKQLINGPRPQEIAQARAQYKAVLAQASLQKAGARPEEIARAEATLSQAHATLQKDEANYQRFQQLYQQQMVSPQELENVKAAYQVSQQQVTVAKQKLLEVQRGNRQQEIASAMQQAKAQEAQLHLLEAGTRPEQIEQQKAVIQTIRAQIAQLDKTTEETIIQSPCECQVNSLDWRPGQLISANQIVASLYNLQDIWVRAYVPEDRFGQMRVNDTVEVTVDAFPNKVFIGRVVQLSSRAEFTPRNVQTEEGRRAQVFGVKIALDNKEQLLRPGMPANITFHLEASERKKESYR